MKLTSEEASFRIRGFDGLRALAVIMVWIEHRASIGEKGIIPSGVDLFFVLSGFLIVDILRRQREKIDSGFSTFLEEWKRFVIRRAFRIFPVYFFFLALVGVGSLFVEHVHIDSTALVLHLFYLVNVWVAFVLGQFNETTTHLWSLSVEEWFYALFPIFALTTPANKILACCIVMICAGVCSGGYLFYQGNHLASGLVGFGFAKIALGGLFVISFASRTPLPGKAFVWPASFLIVYASLPTLIYFLQSNAAFRVMDWVPLTPLVGMVLLGIQRNQSSILVDALEWYPLRSLGVVSYGFYVYHYPLNAYVLGSFFHYDFADHWPKYMIKIAEFALPFLAAVLSWRFIEQPILKRRPMMLDRSL